MTLAAWLETTGTSLTKVAAACGVAISTVSRWAVGEILIDADMVERIAQLTDGAVTAQDMHTVRLAWLKANRPDKFAPAGEVAA